jgi:pyridoxamine 5'-phosphate oxidase
MPPERLTPLEDDMIHIELLPETLPPEPFTLTERWMREAWQQPSPPPNPDAMVLATSDGSGHVSARVVLCKQVVSDPGYVVFFTNYASQKGHELAASPRAAVVMHWDTMHRQVRIEGAVVQAPAAESDAYYASRAWQSRVGAWASRQSQPVASRAAFRQTVSETAARFGVPGPGEPGYDEEREIAIPRPAHWGGFHLWAQAVELWCEGDARLHDRARWTRTLIANGHGGFETGPWAATRLQP